ncbi:polyhydroxyalkanoic acid system family protein [Spongiibacter sp. KMU-158]|uniref:Polyhydroxyalkanoic acid system family protein n=1 Tax=Spongiibacter pelagi TaxID=2760804 RepID=A0A927C0K0_9GAMM|nr:polyhydroxyalkanoic acid system family protein [Spongiibacter pelagi]MBD2858504.1 polyhydroxyalkanoic acid system family protein [Spongiibacter pelagi]
MSDIAIVQTHTLSESELLELVQMVVDKMEQRYQLVPTWVAENTVSLQRTGVKGMLTFDAQQVEVNIKLGMMMRPLRGTIENAVREALREKLG